MGGCIVYTQISVLLLICPFISSFFFLSSFQTLKFFVTLFSGTVRPRRLKLGTHVYNRWMYHIYTGIKLLLLICPFISFFFLSNFQTLKYFVTLFSGTVRVRRLKLGSHVDTGQMYRESGCCCLFIPLFLQFLSLQFSNMNIFRCTFLRSCEA